MPLYRGIKVHLFNDSAQLIEELNLAPPTPPVPSKTSLRTSSSSTATVIQNPRAAPPFAPSLRDDATNTISVYVPYMPKTMFFLRYQVPRLPDTTFQSNGELFYVFKLIINGLEVVTWHCGSQHGFKGKTMFGLFDTGQEQSQESEFGDGDGSGEANDANANAIPGTNSTTWGKGVEKRLWRFGDKDFRVVGDLHLDSEDQRCVEVRVCRADVKVRMTPELDSFRKLYDPRTAELLPFGGMLHHKRAPRRFYKYGLIDPIDEPYAVFRFYYRTWSEIDQLNLRLGTTEGDDASVFSSATSIQTAILDDAGASPEHGSYRASSRAKDNDMERQSQDINQTTPPAKVYTPSGTPTGTPSPNSKRPGPFGGRRMPIRPQTSSPLSNRASTRSSASDWNASRINFSQQDTRYGNAFAVRKGRTVLRPFGDDVDQRGSMSTPPQASQSIRTYPEGSPIAYRQSLLDVTTTGMTAKSLTNSNFEKTDITEAPNQYQHFSVASPSVNRSASTEHREIMQAKADVDKMDRRLSIPPSTLFQPLFHDRGRQTDGDPQELPGLGQGIGVVADGSDQLRKEEGQGATKLNLKSRPLPSLPEDDHEDVATQFVEPRVADKGKGKAKEQIRKVIAHVKGDGEEVMPDKWKNKSKPFGLRRASMAAEHPESGVDVGAKTMGLKEEHKTMAPLVFKGLLRLKRSFEQEKK